MQVVVASTNLVKIEAVRQGFTCMFPDSQPEITGVSVPSGVSDQPMSNTETQTGAFNRAENARGVHPQANYWVGIEGGVEEIDGILHVFAWVVILSPDKIGRSRTATFFLPDEVAVLVRQGMELGEADDVVFGRKNSKQVNGSVGILTGDVIDRAEYYAHAVTLALIPFVNPNLTFTTPNRN